MSNYNYNLMVRVLLLLVLIFPISTLKTHGKIVEFNSNHSKINYTLSCLGIPIKKKSLPVSGSMNVKKFRQEEDKLCGNYLLKKLSLKVLFTSKNKHFRNIINYNRFPYFTFFATLDKPIEVKNQLISIEGILSFHGIDKKIKIKLKNNPKGNSTCLIGFLNIKMSDFGIEPPRFLFLRIDDLIKTRVEIHLNT